MKKNGTEMMIPKMNDRFESLIIAFPFYDIILSIRLNVNTLHKTPERRCFVKKID